MQFTKTVQNLINRKLSEVHTAYIAKIVSIGGGKATVQPLFTTYDTLTGKTFKTSVVSDVPIIQSARYKVACKSIDGHNVLTAQPLSVGDIVLCIACEKDITEAKQGKYDISSLSDFSMSSSVVVGVL